MISQGFGRTDQLPRQEFTKAGIFGGVKEDQDLEQLTDRQASW